MGKFIDKFGMQYEILAETKDWFVLRYLTKGYSFSGTETVRKKSFCTDWRRI